jgi:hypothetical protein
MPEQTFQILGQVIDQTTRKGVSDLRVEAWDHDKKNNDLLGQTHTDTEGRFIIAFDDAKFNDGGADVLPDLYLKVFDGENVVYNTEAQPIKNWTPHQTPLVIEVNPPTAPKGGPYVVTGRVLRADGQPVSGAEAQALHKNLRSEILLGRQRADDLGRYSIRYSPPDGIRHVDLIVRAIRPETDAQIAQSDLICHARKIEVVDLAAGGDKYRGYSEYERISQAARPHLDGATIGELKADDIELLECKTQQNPVYIAYLVIAHRYAQHTQIPAAAFYGFFRMNLPTRLPALVSQQTQAQRRALEEALKANIIPRPLGNQIDDILEQLKRTAVSLTLEAPEGQESVSLAPLLSGAGLSTELQIALLTRYALSQGTIQEFWASLKTDPVFGQPGLVERLQFTLQLGALAGGHAPIVQKLQGRLDSGQISGIKDLAALSREDWLTLVDEAGTPPGTPGDTESERRKNYARLLGETIETAFPTPSVVAGLKRGDTPQDLLRFFENSPDFTFEINVNRFLKEQGEAALDGVEDAAQTTRRLKQLQRVYNLSPNVGRFDAMNVLLGAGLDSARAIVRQGQDTFVRSLDAQLGAEVATEIYANAAQTSARTTAVFGQYSAALSVGTPAVIRNFAAEGSGIPDWESLFGALSFCACEECRSVYSPAAYLVDLLQFIKQQPAIRIAGGVVTYPTIPLPDGKTRFKNALDTLFERRSDIGEIQLSCQNTNTLLPYIDLVNEILENAVVRESTVYQTTWTEEELSANPENQNDKAYNLLARQVYPRLLPFNLWLQEARTYLGHLGVSLVELMEVLHQPGLIGAALASIERRIAVESLGLSPDAARIITDPLGLDRQPWEFWGVNEEDWPGSLNDLPTFLKQAEIDYETLEALRKTEFINASGKLTIVFATPCNLEGATINNLTEVVLDHIHRFLRLQQAVGWEISDLDAAMTAMQAADLTMGFLIQISQIQRLKNELNRPVLEMLSWWSAISVVVDESDPEDRSFYDELFLNNAALNPPDEAFNLNSARSDLQNAGTAPLGEHKPAILAALAITEADLALILTDIGKTELDGLTLELLSELHRNASFAKAHGLSVSEMLSIRKLTGIDPFSSPQRALDFSAEVETIGQSGFSVETLDYLLRGVYTESSGLAPTESGVTLTLDGIKAGLQAIAAENFFTADPTGEITRGRLALLLTGADLEEAIAIIEGSSTLPQTDQEAFIDQHFATFLSDTGEAKAILTRPVDPENQPKERQGRYEYILRPLVAYLRATLSAQLVIQAVADSLGLEMAVAESLLTEYLTPPGGGARKAIDILLNIDLNAATYTETELAVYRLLSKVATVLNTVGATAEELAWLFGEKPAQKPARARLDLNRLLAMSVATDAEAARHYLGWKRIGALYRFRDTHPVAGDITVFSALDMVDSGSARENALQTLNSLTEWDVADLDYLTGPDGFDLSYPADYLDERYLSDLQAAFDLLARLGVAAGEAHGWMVSDNLGRMKEVATAIKSAVKAKYDNETWLSVAEPLKNQLREMQRGALVARLIERRPLIEDADDLFERYLIDVEMSACMKTSRIKQAISSAQLFVQRSLMNLEPEVEITAPYAEQWDWMKNYRVWEANRKIFLYPENWIEPELRDDKSPFFVELENELLQNEITPETAETVLINYLDKLDGVANLDARAIYHQKESGEIPIDILHVFARTYSTPYEYYYRTRVDSASWTPWEKVATDVQGDHLLAFSWNRRIYLFWFPFTEVSLGSGICGSLPDLLVEAYPELTESPEIHLSEEFLEWFEENDIQEQLEIILKADDVDLDTDLDGIITDIRETLDFLLDDSDVDLSGVDQIVKDWAECFVSNGRSQEIQLAWAEYKDGAWSEKRLAPSALTALYRPAKSFLFKPRIDQAGTADEELVITCYAVEKASLMLTVGEFRVTGCNGRVFTNVYNPPEQSTPFLRPASSGFDNMRFIEYPNVDVGFDVPSARAGVNGNLSAGTESDMAPVLMLTPGRFTVTVPHQYNEFVSQDVFFYQDDTRAFLVEPRSASTILFGLQSADSISIDHALQSSIALLNTGRSAGAGLILDQRMASHHSQFGGNGRGPESDMVKAQSRMTIPGLQVNDLAESAVDQLSGAASMFSEGAYDFSSVYHPFVCDLIKTLNRDGIDGVMQRSAQQTESDPSWFTQTYSPVLGAVGEKPQEAIEFTDAAYSLYNWELFFHAPLLIATRLSQNQRFEEAQQWFHYIFNPMARDDSASVTGPERYWNFLPFYEENKPQTIDELMLQLNEGDAELEAQVEAWRATPFNPHLIARMRPVAYQKTVVMKYLDNLIAWGDSLFRQDTIESINEATQLYVLAANILGPRPQSLPADSVEDSQTYNSLADKLDAFSNALIQIENEIPVIKHPIFNPLDSFLPRPPIEFPHLPHIPLPSVETLYFCVPQNDMLCSYWDTIADRLFKIRNCMNIEGVVRELALFEPPIDPALLVQAAAAGIDISSALSDLYAPTPCYRFQLTLQKAMEFCGDVRSLGATLLSALEKKDAEALALLRASHETQILEAAKYIREQSVSEARETLAGLEQSKAMAEARLAYFTSREYANPSEKLQMTLMTTSIVLQGAAQLTELTASFMHGVPDGYAGGAGYAGSPLTFTHFGGGSKTAAGLQAFSRSVNGLAGVASAGSSLAGARGGFDRRAEEWAFQADLAEKEIEQIYKQLAAAQIRIAIAEQELENHNQQIEHARDIQTFMADKYTNDQLYSWMISQISGIYFQSYQMAYDLAKRAEKAYQHELGVTASSFISFGYWDSLKKGLMSGEKLLYDLRRLEMSYFEQNRREYEITKHISLAALDPAALIQLRQTGKCSVSLPEALFDLDYPGHYLRRIKNVSVTIPCVSGPYTGVNCALTLLKSSIRRDGALLNGQYGRDVVNGDLRFTDSYGMIQSIVTSAGQNDSGLFETNLRDERYLPFEGAGVISDWSIEMPGDFRAFDYDTISDLILHLRYTAREAGALKTQASAELQDAVNAIVQSEGEGLARLYSARHEFPGEWRRFLNPADTTSPNALKLAIAKDRFPFMFQGKKISIGEIEIYLKVNEGFEDAYNPSSLSCYLDEGATAPTNQLNLSVWNGLLQGRRANLSWTAPIRPEEGEWTLTLALNLTEALDPNALEDIFVVCRYGIS